MAKKKAVSKGRSRRKATKKKTALQHLEEDVLPREMGVYVRRVRRGLARIERELETAQKGASRRWARLLRDTSHQLGRIEEAGERAWRRRTLRARRDAVALLKRLERAIEPPARKKKARRKTAGPRRKKARVSAPAARPARPPGREGPAIAPVSRPAAEERAPGLGPPPAP